MFQLSIVDHIRLTFGDVVCGYATHSTAARRLARRSWQLKTTVLGLLGLAVICCGAAASVDTGRPFRVAAAVVSMLAFAAYALYLVMDVDPQVLAHRSCAARFWLLAEKYRSLLAEIHDGLLDTPAIAERRDALIREVHAVYDQAPVGDRETYRLVRQWVAPRPASLSDEEIDTFLPRSLQREHPPTAAA